jgi:TonB family protein
MKHPITPCLAAPVLCLAMAQAMAAPSPQPVSPATQAYGREVYRAVSQQIAADAAKNIPLIQHDFGTTGTIVEVAFIVLPTGQVARDRILRSSGNKQFDAEVLGWTGTMKLPPFPPGIREKQMTFAVPYFFRGSGAGS